MKYRFWHSESVNPTMIHIQIIGKDSMYLYTPMRTFSTNAFNWACFTKHALDKKELTLKEFCERYLITSMEIP